MRYMGRIEIKLDEQWKNNLSPEILKRIEKESVRFKTIINKLVAIKNVVSARERDRCPCIVFNPCVSGIRWKIYLQISGISARASAGDFLNPKQ